MGLNSQLCPAFQQFDSNSYGYWKKKSSSESTFQQSIERTRNQPLSGLELGVVMTMSFLFELQQLHVLTARQFSIFFRLVIIGSGGCIPPIHSLSTA
ncbi:hypothetical protein M8C21_015948 [Ambrosia artemisiifolia]|uniref:Uncharacterized protein n=1 Tax=Ambrosia artemisiifolia TaxID=4212 RepID=A0AAD5BN71_AMBAR|nr:hypothetical protein M8C21_015948 [Ambrosia artemisiifolia]